jgi:hypothetical protein
MEWPLLADTVAKVENRKAPKISQMLIFGELYRCNASQRRYEGPRLFLREMMWSLTFPRTNRISGLYNFRPPPETILSAQSGRSLTAVRQTLACRAYLSM